jgi:hypothetical protein
LIPEAVVKVAPGTSNLVKGVDGRRPTCSRHTDE